MQLYDTASDWIIVAKVRDSLSKRIRGITDGFSHTAAGFATGIETIIIMLESIIPVLHFGRIVRRKMMPSIAHAPNVRANR